MTTGHSLRRGSIVARWRERDRGDEGMTLVEVLLASTVLVVLLSMVAISMSVLNNISGAVSSQFQEYDQALPALAPIQALIRAEVEPAAPNGSGAPTPAFAQFGTTSLNFGLQFYSNVGTAYNNLTAAGTTAGPAKIVALELDQSGNPVTSSTSCTAKSPCRFQVRRYLPVVNSGTSTCPVTTDGSAGPCLYPSNYTLITNAADVVNNPSSTTGGVPNQPIFTYSLFDPNWPAGANSTGTGILLTAGEIQNNLITGLTAAPYNYPTNTQTVTACAFHNASYPTTAIACPLDAVQSVSIELMVAAPGSGTNGTVDNQTVVYRYPPTGTGGNITYPYQFSNFSGVSTVFHASEWRWIRQLRRSIVRRKAVDSDLGQTAMVAVVAFSVLASSIAAVLVSQVIGSFPLQQSKSVQIYANRALEAGVNAYVTAVNTNPSLAQCNSNTNTSGICSGIDYGQWNFVPNSNTSGADSEYYAFGNPQPTFDPTTNALSSLSVEVVGAAYDVNATNHYLFAEETIGLSPANGFLKNVWWSNYESYSSNGNYSSCNYNWKLGYNISNANAGCGPVYFGPADYLFGPVYTNDSVFVAGNGGPTSSPSFGTTGAPSPVTTADPNCLFVNNTYGMGGSDANCSQANGSVALYDTTNSSFAHAVETPPASDSQLGVIASQNGCLYSGPTQVTLSTAADGTGQMTVVSPDTIESTVNQGGTNYTWDNNNISTNLNNCPNDGTAPLPPNGVVFVQNAPTSQTQQWANPLDDPVDTTVTNLTSSPSSPQAGRAVTLTATVTSDSNQIDNGATVAFSQTTNNFGNIRTAVINSCSAVTLSSPVAVVPATTPASVQVHGNLLDHRGQQRDRGVLRRLQRRQLHRLVVRQPRADLHAQPGQDLRALRTGHRRWLLELLLRADQRTGLRRGRLRQRQPVGTAHHRHRQQPRRRRQHHLQRLHLDDG